MQTNRSEAGSAAGGTTLAIILPAFNEEEGIVETIEHIGQVCGDLDATIATRMIIVDDGSEDRTAERVAGLERDDVDLIRLNRNFGKESAILAGLSHTDASAAIVMDADLQHPPALIPSMVALWQGGADVVHARRRDSVAANGVARAPSRLFLNLFRKLSGLDLQGATDFKLLDRRVIDVYVALPERTRFFRGLVAWMAYPSAMIPFDPPLRSRGRTSWSGVGLVRYSLRSLTAFTAFPLYAVGFIGLGTFAVSAGAGVIALFDKLTGTAVDGFTTVILLLMLVAGALLFSVGLLGVYVARIYDELKARPAYLIGSLEARNATSSHAPGCAMGAGPARDRDDDRVADQCH